MRTREEIIDLDDVALVRLLTLDSAGQTKEELRWAEAEANRRGVPIDAAFIPDEPVGAVRPARPVWRSFWEGRSRRELGVLCALLFAAVVVINLEAMGLASGCVAGTLFLVLLGHVLFLLVAAAVCRRSVVAVQGITILLVTGAALFFANVVRYEQVQVSKSRGDDLSSALARYRADNGEYPMYLSLLVPAYLEEVPVAAVGVLTTSRFGYIRWTDSFSISFPESAKSWWSRRPATAWQHSVRR